MDIKKNKSRFPNFKQKINGKPLVYLDSANSSQKPKAVINRLSNFYETEFSNVGRSVHSLAVTATNRFEETRDKVQKYLNAKHREEIIFTKSATESINLIASSSVAFFPLMRGEASKLKSFIFLGLIISPNINN